MGRKKRDKLEFRFYEIPERESVLALYGDRWVGTYGHNDICMHFHNLFEIGICLRGQGLLILGEEEQVYEGGMISAIPAHFPHITVSEDVDAWEYLFLDTEELIRELFPGDSRAQEEALRALNRRADLFRVEEQPEYADTVKKILREMQEKKPYYRDAVHRLVQICMLELIRIQGLRPPDKQRSALPEIASMNQILPALRYIDEHYAGAIRASELAGSCGLSEPQFRRIFEDCINMAPMDYLNLTRVQKACKLLRKTDLSMEIVAAKCGFPSISTFTRNFRKFLDTTPYQWKRNRDSYPYSLNQFQISARKGWQTL
jgi:AraC-like DNA-binding protein